MSSEKQKSKNKAKPSSTRAKTAKASPPRKKRSPERPLILVSGSGAILDEFLVQLAETPYDIAVLRTRSMADWPEVPAGIRTLARPDKRASIVIELSLGQRAQKQEALELMDRSYGPETLILSNALAISVAEQASWLKGKHRLLGIGLLPGFPEKTLIEIAPSALTLKQTVETARRFFESIGKETELVQDRVGMVSARIICQIINEAAFALQDEIALPQDIDTSMKLGVSYPRGPFEWAERLGMENVVSILSALHDEYQEERYRVSPLLRTMALNGIWWTPAAESVKKGNA